MKPKPIAELIRAVEATTREHESAQHSLDSAIARRKAAMRDLIEAVTEPNTKAIDHDFWFDDVLYRLEIGDQPGSGLLRVLRSRKVPA